MAPTVMQAECPGKPIAGAAKDEAEPASPLRAQNAADC